jgi:hypothetical protein
MKINVCDNMKDDRTSVYKKWTESHNWYRSADAFPSTFPNDWKFTYWQPDNNDVTVFVTKGIYDVDNIESKIKIALPSDLRDFHGPIYDFIEENIDKFDTVVTYDERLLELYPDKCFAAAAMKPWIWPIEIQAVYPKTRLCSFISSTKMFTRGHRYRTKTLVQLKSLQQDGKLQHISAFGEGHNPIPEDEGKIHGLKDYAFSVAMENHQSNYYFSEKLLDVILAGCIPIYWGSKTIGEHFNLDGFITFDTREELLYDILPNLSMELYASKLDAVKENLETCQKYYLDNFNYYVKKGTTWLQ